MHYLSIKIGTPRYSYSSSVLTVNTEVTGSHRISQIAVIFGRSSFLRVRHLTLVVHLLRVRLACEIADKIVISTRETKIFFFDPSCDEFDVVFF